WSQVACGDRIVLSAVSTDPIQAERLQLNGWQPGPRLAFGPDRAILPVVRIDDEAYATRLGAGDYQLTIPMRWGEDVPSLVGVFQDGKIQGITGRWRLSAGECVLLTADGDVPRIAGFSSLRPVPDSAADLWREDPLADIFAGENAQRSQRIAQLIVAAGGALPV